jgi:HNH endonuclease
LNLKEARKKYRYVKSRGQIILLESKYRPDCIGRPLGTLRKDGYVELKVEGRSVLLHRFAWFLVTGKWPTELDHRNTVRNDNRWRNLRDATRAKNRGNSNIGKNNVLGIKGVRIHQKGKFEARFRQRSLGYFDRADLAAVAYAKAAKKYFGEFARTA